jgi:1,4-alpha-glucan branching enzyme
MEVFESELPLHFFHHGENFKAYEFFGAHAVTVNKKRGYIFRVWAPRAVSVSVVGDFNDWNETTHPMYKLIDGETFELFIPGLIKDGLNVTN